MRILFDQGTPVPLRRHLQGHSVKTAYEEGWATLSNGDLLTAAETHGYDLLVTTDRNLRYQQNLRNRRIAIVCYFLLPGRAFVNIQKRFNR
jgi:hypothetical protein